MNLLYLICRSGMQCNNWSFFYLQTRGKETHQLGVVARLCRAPGVVAPGG